MFLLVKEWQIKMFKKLLITFLLASGLAYANPPATQQPLLLNTVCDIGQSTGGTIITSGGYRIHDFTSSGTFVLACNSSAYPFRVAPPTLTCDVPPVPAPVDPPVPAGPDPPPPEPPVPPLGAEVDAPRPPPGADAMPAIEEALPAEPGLLPAPPVAVPPTVIA